MDYASMTRMLMSSSILAVYDLGATAQQLEAIYAREDHLLLPIHTADQKTKSVEEQQVQIESTNWSDFLGQDKYVLVPLFA